MGGACSRRIGVRESSESVNVHFPHPRDLTSVRLLRSRSKNASFLCKEPLDRSLLDACIFKILERIEAFTTFSELPRDLSQKLFYELAGQGRLTPDLLPLFNGCMLEDILFQDQFHVTDEWLMALSSHSGSLVALDLTNCVEITSVGVCQFVNPRNLESLVLNECAFVSDEGLLAFAECPKLEKLSLQGCHAVTADGLSVVRNMPRLVELNLERCFRIGGGLHHLAGLPALRLLNVGWCNTVTDADAVSVAELSSLEEVQLSRTKVTDVGLRSLLRGLMNLRILALAGCQITDKGLASISNLTALSVLNLNWCSGVSSQGLQHLKGLKNLRNLNLGYTAVAKNLGPLTGLSRLEELNLESTAVTDSDMEYIQELPSIRSLDLSDTSIGDYGVHFLSALPLTSLNLSFSLVSDTGLASIGKMRRLQSLSADSQNVTDAGICHLSSLTALTSLDLFGAKITDNGIAHVKCLSRLRSLEVCGGGVTDRGVQLLRGLTSLTCLNLSQNHRVTDSALMYLAEMNLLEKLNISGCGVHGNGLSYISKLSKLENLALHSCKVSKSHLQRLQLTNGCQWPPTLFVAGVES